MTNRELENVKKVIYTKIAMAVNVRGIKTDDKKAMELALRKCGDFTQSEIDLVFGKKPDEYYAKIEKDRKIKLGLIEEHNPNENKEAAYLKVQARKKEKELSDMLGQTNNVML